MIFANFIDILMFVKSFIMTKPLHFSLYLKGNTQSPGDINMWQHIVTNLMAD